MHDSTSGAHVRRHDGLFSRLMISGRRRVALAVTLLTLLAAGGIADAGSRRGGRGGGRLGKVVGGIRSSGGSRGGGGRVSSGHGSSGHGHIRSGYRSYRGPGLWSTASYGGLTFLRPTVDLYGGLQRVVESDGAAIGEVRLGFDRIALLGRYSGYQESAGPGLEPIRLDLAAAGVGFELFGGRDGKVWLEGFVSGIRTVPSDRRAGVAIGLRVEQRLDARFSLFGAARRYMFTGDVKATEAVAGIQASFLRASYRILDFNVGPALRGPEIGIAARF